jgi:hypothetical protein
LRKLLTSQVKYWFEHPKELQKLKPQRRGRFYSNCRKDTKEALEYLALLAEHLPEKQRQKTFTKESLEPFIKAVLSYEPREGTQLRNERAFDIALMLILEGENTAWGILPALESSMLENYGKMSDRSRIIKTIGPFLPFIRSKDKKKK